MVPKCCLNGLDNEVASKANLQVSPWGLSQSYGENWGFTKLVSDVP